MQAKLLSRWFLSQNPSLKNGYVDENTRLNKLLYFASLMYYAVTGKQLLENDFEHWNNGPVIREIYRDYRYEDLANEDDENVLFEDEVAKKVAYIVNFVYGGLTAKEIAEESHKSTIWKNTQRNEIMKIENIDEDEKWFMVQIYNMYKGQNFENYLIEKVNGNIYYYNKNELKLTEALLRELEEITEPSEPVFLSMVDGELVFL